MYHTDKLSVFLESGDHNQERTLNEFPLLKGDDSKENLTRVVVSIKPRTALRITLQTHEDFDLLDATGLRVTIANSRGVYSSDDVQSWWVPREDLTCPNDTETSWEGFWTWSSDSASRGRRRIVAPAPPCKRSVLFGGSRISNDTLLRRWRFQEHTVCQLGRKDERRPRLHCCVRHTWHFAESNGIWCQAMHHRSSRREEVRRKTASADFG